MQLTFAYRCCCCCVAGAAPLLLLLLLLLLQVYDLSKLEGDECDT
jgi:hypothetical protein